MTPINPTKPEEYAATHDFVQIVALDGLLLLEELTCLAVNSQCLKYNELLITSQNYVLISIYGQSFHIVQVNYVRTGHH